MLRPEDSRLHVEAAAEETDLLALDKETLKDLDAAGDQSAGVKGGMPVTFIVCLSIECWTKGCYNL